VVEFLFQRLALRELRSALSWYGERSEKARQGFRRAVFEAMDRIDKNPEAHAIIVAPYRIARIRRYPYTLIFDVRLNKVIYIIAVGHTSRRPGYWQRRK